MIFILPERPVKIKKLRENRYWREKVGLHTELKSMCILLM